MKVIYQGKEYNVIEETYHGAEKRFAVEYLLEGMDAPVSRSECTIIAEQASKTINRITREDVQGFRDAATHFNMPHNTLNSYQRIATKSAIYPGQGTPLGLAYVALKMNGEAGEFAEHVGKAMRDDSLMPVGPMNGIYTAALNCEPTPERRALLIKEVGDVLWYLSAACNELNISLSETALINLEKLCDRGERDALRGSGDER